MQLDFCQDSMVFAPFRNSWVGPPWPLFFLVFWSSKLMLQWPIMLCLQNSVTFKVLSHGSLPSQPKWFQKSKKHMVRFSMAATPLLVPNFQICYFSHCCDNTWQKLLKQGRVCLFSRSIVGGSRNVRHVVTLHPYSGNRERWMLVLSSCYFSPRTKPTGRRWPWSGFLGSVAAANPSLCEQQGGEFRVWLGTQEGSWLRAQRC